MVFKKVLKFGVIGLTCFMLAIIGGVNMVGFAQTGAPSEYTQIEETISPIALDLMGKWILDRTGQISYLLKKE